jgi:DNA polymerase-3 subunit epsilon
MIVLFFDTETTGFPNESNPPEIVQIGALLEDTDSGRILAELNLIVQAGGPIPQATIDVHGITDELSARHGIKKEIADNMFAILAKQADRVVAHNIEFDRKVINGIWPISGAIIAMKEEYCTMQNCAPFGDMPRRHATSNKFTKLADAYRYFYRKDFDNAHDAMADVRACQDLYHLLQIFERNR